MSGLPLRDIQKMAYSTKQSAQYVRQIAEANGVEHVIMSPGSRNAPLIIEFGRSETLTSITIPDERVAAFVGMGTTLHTGKPSVLVCTSGSALLNYYPAIAEAFYQSIPMVILSADRPLEWTDQNDGQTIRQDHVFANHILYSRTLFKDTTDEQSRFANQRIINEAFNTAIHKKGPVHINLPFEEPLYDVTDVQEKAKVIHYHSALPVPDETTLSRFRDILHESEKVMLLVGQNQHLSSEVVNQFSKTTGAAVLSETTSNVSGDRIIPTIDRVLDMEDPASFAPDLLITVGQAVISKKIKAFLRKYRPPQHWHIANKDLHPDTYQSLTHSIVAEPEDTLMAFSDYINHKDEGYRDAWIELSQERRERHQLFMSGLPYCDLKVFEIINESVKQDWNIHWANSTAIRYAQLFEFLPAVKHFCNRGTSGIDGSTSTALGHALASCEKTLMVTGDISFLYDSNALFNNHYPSNLRIVVINNSGGGIFRFIPGPDTTNHLEEVFESRHPFHARGISENFGLNYQAAQNPEECVEGLKELIDINSKLQILEIFTHAETNALQLKNYFKFLRNG